MFMWFPDLYLTPQYGYLFPRPTSCLCGVYVFWKWKVFYSVEIRLGCSVFSFSNINNTLYLFVFFYEKGTWRKYPLFLALEHGQSKQVEKKQIHPSIMLLLSLVDWIGICFERCCLAEPSAFLKACIVWGKWVGFCFFCLFFSPTNAQVLIQLINICCPL